MRGRRRERRFERAPFGAQVELWKNRTPTPVTALDISRGGLFLRTTEPIAEGSYLTLRIGLPGGPRFSALCRVIRVQAGGGLLSAPGIGVEFLDVGPREKRAIDDYVTRALRRAELAA